MTRLLAATAVVVTLTASSAIADEHRGGDAALGALSGAVVFGPVGAVAGAVVGYTAGPSIARSWGFRRSHAARSQVRRPTRDSQAAMTEPQQPQQAAPRGATPQPKTAAAAPPAPRGPVAPPVQTLE